LDNIRPCLTAQGVGGSVCAVSSGVCVCVF